MTRSSLLQFVLPLKELSLPESPDTPPLLLLLPLPLTPSISIYIHSSLPTELSLSIRECHDRLSPLLAAQMLHRKKERVIKFRPAHGLSTPDCVQDRRAIVGE